MGALILVAGIYAMLKAWGKRPLILTSVALTCLVLVVAHWHPVIAISYFQGKPFEFYRTAFLAYALCGIVASFLAFPGRLTKERTRIIIAFVVGFLVAWGGEFVT